MSRIRGHFFFAKIRMDAVQEKIYLWLRLRLRESAPAPAPAPDSGRGGAIRRAGGAAALKKKSIRSRYCAFCPRYQVSLKARLILLIWMAAYSV